MYDTLSTSISWWYSLTLVLQVCAPVLVTVCLREFYPGRGAQVLCGYWCAHSLAVPFAQCYGLGRVLASACICLALLLTLSM